MGALWMDQLLDFLQNYWLYLMLAIFVLAEIRRVMIPKFDRWQQDVTFGGPFVYLVILGVLWFYQWFYSLRFTWAREEVAVAMALVLFTAGRWFYSNFRLRQHKPGQRTSETTGTVRYR